MDDEATAPARDVPPVRPFWRVPPHVARELAERIALAGADLTGVVIRIDEDRHASPMTFEVTSSAPAVLRVTPLNDTFKCPPRCS